MTVIVSVPWLVYDLVVSVALAVVTGLVSVTHLLVGFLWSERSGHDVGSESGVCAAVVSVGRIPVQIIAESVAMKELLALAQRLKRVDVTVLIEGESGTGKELVARAIHDGSARRRGPFVAVNCAAVPETLVESEFFGHEPGAFTGAARRKPGRFALADGGTLFLDEVTELPLTAQAKLLRVIQERELDPLGAVRSRAIDVRIIAATNQDIAQLVDAGGFRRDLYYRLHVIPLRVPPLRDRLEDIPALAAHFLAIHAERAGKPMGRFTAPAMQALRHHPWPGNVRELEHAVQRAVVLGQGPDIGPPDLGLAPRVGRDPALHSGAARRLVTVQRELILAVLRECGGNRTQAARRLGVDRSTLWRKLRWDATTPEGDQVRDT